MMSRWFGLIALGAVLAGCSSSGSGLSATQEKALHDKLAKPPNAKNRGVHKHKSPPGALSSTTATTSGDAGAPPN